MKTEMYIIPEAVTLGAASRDRRCPGESQGFVGANSGRGGINGY